MTHNFMLGRVCFSLDELIVGMLPFFNSAKSKFIRKALSSQILSGCNTNGLCKEDHEQSLVIFPIYSYFR